MNDQPKTLPRLSLREIFNMSFGFLGIQVAFGLQNGNASRIFESLGAPEDRLPILWLAAPITGILVQPIVGYLSDRTWGKLGRRRPYFLTGAILASLGLFIMPNSHLLWIAAGTLWILDASINISMEPFRALVADKLPAEQRTAGFGIQSFFIGTGGIIGSFLPWVLAKIGISNVVAPGQALPPTVKIAFYIGAFLFLAAVLWTVATTTEYPPSAEQEAHHKENRGLLHGVREIMHLLGQMPQTMRQLAFVQFFTWFALFGMWIYTTSAVTTHIYHALDKHSALYNEGANWVNVMFAVYNGFSAIAAFLLLWLGKRGWKRKTIHFLCLVIGALSLASIYVIHQPSYLLVPMLGVGIAWASILSMPYAILAGALPKDNVGVYMGIFNFFIVIPQICAAGVLGFFMRTFLGGQAINALALAGGSMLLAAILVLRVQDAD